MENKYELVIRPESAKKKSPVAGSKAQSQSERKQARFERSLKGLVSYDTVTGTIDNAVNYNIGRVSVQTGAAEYEQRLQTAYDAVSSGRDLVKSSIASFGIGGVPLLAFNLMMKGSQSLINTLQKYDTVQNQRNLESISVEMYNRRAGVGGRRGNNQ